MESNLVKHHIDRKFSCIFNACEEQSNVRKQYMEYIESCKRMGPNKTLLLFHLVHYTILLKNKRSFSLMEKVFPAKILYIFAMVFITKGKTLRKLHNFFKTTASGILPFSKILCQVKKIRYA